MLPSTMQKIIAQPSNTDAIHSRTTPGCSCLLCRANERNSEAHQKTQQPEGQLLLYPSFFSAIMIFRTCTFAFLSYEWHSTIPGWLSEWFQMMQLTCGCVSHCPVVCLRLIWVFVCTEQKCHSLRTLLNGQQIQSRKEKS